MATTTAEIRQQILTNLRTNMPDYLWVDGEPLVDILDSVADFQFKREFISTLTQNLNNINGFDRLINDKNYRMVVSDVLDLSTTQRVKTWIGVPADVTSDLDAFVWYYLDRFAETKGYSRIAGKFSTAIVKAVYPNTYTTGTANVILQGSGKLYKFNIDFTRGVLNGSNREYIGLLYSFGFGSKYNIRGNALSVKSAYGMTATDVTFPELSSGNINISGGTDYQTNESFLIVLQTNMSENNGVGVRNSIAQTITSIKTIEKFAISSVDNAQRFIGSINIYIKGGTSAIWPIDCIVSTDKRILIPYQPAQLQTATIKSSGTALIENADYFINTVTGSYEHSVRQITYVDFNIYSGVDLVFDGTETITLSLLVDLDCINVNKALNSYYSKLYEFARDYLIYQAQAQKVDIDLKIRLKTNISQSNLESLINSNIQTLFTNIQIENGNQESALDASDIIANLYGITYQGYVVIDSIDNLIITKTDENGNKSIIAADMVENTGRLLLSNGQYWELSSLTVAVVS